MELEKEKAELIEMFGVHFERLYHLPPLASRILGILILDGFNNGITFEELVERTHSSKSSVSTNIQLLLKMGKINYYTVAGDRRKFFKPSPFSERLDNYLKIINFEKKIIERMINYRKETSTGALEILDLKNIVAYQQHVLDAEKMLYRTIEKFREIEQTNKNQ
ncbi:GbsR/MarR family transcriptional regulator [Flavobacterium silvaticum]|uniref:Transcriptional regulator n=1 Tax=Flavobacterium silvaticum TaxID=1852020 RepID=A0A972FTC1_9FLAO|nr:hypothetical protein [Flavobacterium silvaticum]NMH27622.1 hypothetical protein [Flavobacterium silvaticum]